jgi:hypothetical protein
MEKTCEASLAEGKFFLDVDQLVDGGIAESQVNGKRSSDGETLSDADSDDEDETNGTPTFGLRRRQTQTNYVLKSQFPRAYFKGCPCTPLSIAMARYALPHYVMRVVVLLPSRISHAIRPCQFRVNRLAGSRALPAKRLRGDNRPRGRKIEGKGESRT